MQPPKDAGLGQKGSACVGRSRVLIGKSPTDSVGFGGLGGARGFKSTALPLPEVCDSVTLLTGWSGALGGWGGMNWSDLNPEWPKWLEWGPRGVGGSVGVKWTDCCSYRRDRSGWSVALRGARGPNGGGVE